MDRILKHQGEPPGLAPHAKSSTAKAKRGNPRFRLAERGLTLIGLVLLGIWAGASLESRVHEKIAEKRFLERVGGVPMTEAAGGASFVARRARHDAASGMALGKIEIPRLGVSAMIAEGEDPVTLWQGVGHLPGSAFPGEWGNVALAGHRDTFFRALRNIAVSDRIILSTRDGVFRYRVESTRVVGPEHVSVLDKGEEAALTLVTCYPFYWIGRAPDRFVVRAVRERDLSAPGSSEPGERSVMAAVGPGRAETSPAGDEPAGAGRKD